MIFALDNRLNLLMVFGAAIAIEDERLACWLRLEMRT